MRGDHLSPVRLATRYPFVFYPAASAVILLVLRLEDHAQPFAQWLPARLFVMLVVSAAFYAICRPRGRRRA